MIEDARALHREIGVADFHVDSLIWHRIFRYRLDRRHRAGLKGQPFLWHADLPRMKEAGYRAACMGVHYWPIERDTAWREALRQIDALDRIAAGVPSIVRVRERRDWERAREAGVLALAPGVEGAHILAGRLGRVEELARRGVAYLTLAHFSRNRAASPTLGLGANEVDPLTPFGRDLVAELERHRVLVDVAHVNMPGVLDACSRATRPVLCTHIGMRAVHPHARNLTDDAARAIASTGGVIGIIASSTFLAGTRRADSSAVVRHVEHAVETAGVRHVALGTDYDGMIPIPSDQRDCRDLVRVTAGLLARGHGRDDLALLLRDNALRILTS